MNTVNNKENDNKNVVQHDELLFKKVMKELVMSSHMNICPICGYDHVHNEVVMLGDEQSRQIDTLFLVSMIVITRCTKCLRGFRVKVDIDQKQIMSTIMNINSDNGVHNLLISYLNIALCEAKQRIAKHIKNKESNKLIDNSLKEFNVI